MGQQAGALLTPCVVRGKTSSSSRDGLVANLKRVEALLAQPEKLESECDFHFRRAGLDAHGTLRRLELRRLLWTFAHGLGSEELTWEAIEAAAVAGTLEPHVPVVTGAEFYRCVLKTVHLVAAELQRKVAEADARQRAREAPQRPQTRWATLEKRKDVASEDSDSSRSSSPAPKPAAPCEPEAEFSGSKGAGKGQTPPPRPPETKAPQEPLALPLFRPAPGGSEEEAAPVNGMTAMVLSNEGTFDAQRLFVGRGTLVLSDPERPEPGVAQRLLGSDERSAFDLSLLEFAAPGDGVVRTPLAAMLQGLPLPSGELERLLVLGFAGEDVLCLWFPTPQDCDLCRRAVEGEGAAARDRQGLAA
mmetsp:Transcript_18906/g.59432  ORF Transcript_18906/g.59432 Transcript_18906/m.59432 type:complete len:360 (-) Transcript_18906:15-1094(-)